MGALTKKDETRPRDNTPDQRRSAGQPFDPFGARQPAEKQHDWVIAKTVHTTESEWVWRVASVKVRRARHDSAALRRNPMRDQPLPFEVGHGDDRCHLTAKRRHDETAQPQRQLWSRSSPLEMEKRRKHDWAPMGGHVPHEFPREDGKAAVVEMHDVGGGKLATQCRTDSGSHQPTEREPQRRRHLTRLRQRAEQRREVGRWPKLDDGNAIADEHLRA